jgi:hypothetical protein
MNREILNIVNRVLSEEISDKISYAKGMIYENKNMCEQCGSEMKEGECRECGYMEGEVSEKLYGNQYKLDKNKNGRLDSQDFKLLRRKRKHIDEIDVEEGNAFGKAVRDAKKRGDDEFEFHGKNYPVKESFYSIVLDNEKFIFNENEMVDIIENIVLEEKKKKKQKTTDPIKLTKSNIEKSGKENEDYIQSVVKKMKDYLKDASKGKYEMNPDYFPKGNGELAKMSKMAYVPSDAVGEYIDNFTSAGLENLDYDEIHPDEEWVSANIEGSSRTGNNSEWANAVKTPNNEKRNKIRKDNLLAKIKRKAYNKSPQPVVNDNAGEATDKASKLMLKLESTGDKKVLSDIEKIKDLISYSKKTQ